MKNKIGLYVLYAIVVIAIIYLVYATQGFGLWKNQGGEEAKTGQYQAVFLTNNQVYFGKLEAINSHYATMSDIYYLQVQQLQPKDESTTGNQKLTLVKLGNELHGPVDKMKINTDQILFWEDLKEEGKVVQAIKQYQEKGPTTESTNNSTVVPEEKTTTPAE